MMQDQDDFVLSPAYDLLSTRLILAESVDPEELALSLNGKKLKLSRTDFLQFAENIGLLRRVAEAVIGRFANTQHQALALISDSFLSSKLQRKYSTLMQERMGRLAES